MNASIPAIAPKGTLSGDFSNTPYSDCWWTYGKCVNPKLVCLSNDIASVLEPRTLGYGFDDGPNCSHNAFYDYLTQQGQKATRAQKTCALEHAARAVGGEVIASVNIEVDIQCDCPRTLSMNKSQSLFEFPSPPRLRTRRRIRPPITPRP
ncbi:hypothetical protein B0H10DRAFT_2436979 [Mycena sp. CBHHK59/15]|nr:hypothetical protein B0H10DRAFT_2436979 [Mycena sp. CBHHK59/15]